MWRDRLSGGALLTLVVLAAVTAAAGLLSRHNPTDTNLAAALQLPSGEWLLGTDNLGRDLLARTLYGGRASLLAASIVVLGTLIVSLFVGLPCGYLGGWLDLLIMRLVDVWMAIPRLVLAIAVAALLGPGLRNLILAVLFVSWAPYSQIVRGLVLRSRQQLYIEAAEVLGASKWRLMRAHLLPAIAGEVAVLAAIDVGQTVLTLASLSFLGLGARPPDPEWGAMLNEARPFVFQAPLLMIVPGLCIALVVLASNLLGDGLRDAFDPATRRGTIR